MPKSTNLALSLPRKGSDQKENGTKNPLSPRSPQSPSSAISTNNDEPNGRANLASGDQTPTNATFPNSENSIDSPASPRHRKDSSRSIFSNYRASKSSQRLDTSEASIRQVSDAQGAGSNGQVYSYRKSPVSTPELGMTSENASETSALPSQADVGERYNAEANMKSSSTSNVDSDLNGSRRGPGKHRIQTMLTRTRSTSSKEREDGSRPKPKPITPTRLPEADTRPAKTNSEQFGMKTAPIEKERSFREMMSSSIRNRSVDRHPQPESEDDGRRARKDKKDFSLSSSFKEGTGASLLSNIKHSSTRAADGIGKAGKGIFGKLTRSGSSNEREQHHDENYVCKVINLPLVEQTRRTRISKRLEDSKDKTEFWMPALPWRCIDYLNMKGTEEEGLYRVPGSGREVKHWQMRFDMERDINLFDEPDLYDINIIGSMFKAWLRDLPDEILPKSTQARIAEQCAGAKTTPQMLKDELSKLPPFNYYLLFAITCHISLLHSCSDSNKMDYRNLCICFQPCMKIEAFCFQFLVLDWRNCWQGCWTEKEYLNEELRVLRGSSNASAQQNVAATAQAPGVASHHPSHPPSSHSEDRAVSSAGSSLPSVSDNPPTGNLPSAAGNAPPGNLPADKGSHEKPRPPPLNSDRLQEYNDDDHTPTQGKPHGQNNQLLPLAPVQPLSPMGPI